MSRIYGILSPKFKESVINKVRIEADKIIDSRNNKIEIKTLNHIYSVITGVIDWNLLKDQWIRDHARRTAKTINLHINNDDAVYSILYRYICDFPVAKKAQLLMEAEGD